MVHPYNCMVTHTMKTTIDLPDELLAEAKALAAKRRTTLKAMVVHALTREIQGAARPGGENPCFSVDEHGLPVLKKSGDTMVTSETIYEMMDELGV